MDWIYRCEIFACLFLCPEKFFLQLNVYSDSIWSWSAQHWRGHEFAFGEIHGSCHREIFFLFHWTWSISKFCNNTLVSYHTSFKRKFNRVCRGWGGQHIFDAKISVISAVDTCFASGRSSLGADFLPVSRGVSVWWWPSFYPFHRMDFRTRQFSVSINVKLDCTH